MITAQIIASFATILSVILMSKEKLGGWLWGIIGLSAFFLIYLNEKLYLQMGLQVLFVGQAIYGYITWKRGNDKHLHPTWGNLGKSLSLFGGIFIASIFLSMVYGSFTDASSPFFDTWTTGLCILGNLWLAKKYIQGWIVWALVNVILFFIFYSSGLYISSVVEIILFSISISNIMQWKSRRYKKS